ncbi:MAG: hypothetical protein L0H93_07950 [Nocardioides sp.]|nr:hypothetical protein [Nocardioides sp.]
MTASTPAARPTGVPGRWRPRWRDLPALGWVHARAYTPFLVLAWLVYPLALGMVSSAHACGNLAAADNRRAVLALSHPGHRQVLFAVAGGLGGITAGLLPFLGMSGLLLGAVVAFPGIATTIPEPLLLQLVTAPLTAVMLGGSVVVLLGGRQMVSAASSLRGVRDPDSGGPVRVLGGFAAWPHSHGHGKALVQGLLVDPGVTGTFVAVARHEDLAAWYRRLGMKGHPDTPDVLYLKR